MSIRAMKKIKPIKKLKLYGFNNLTKSLSFNMYDICYAKLPQHRKEYIDYIDEEYNAERLTAILSEVANIIGANILNIAQQDYDPQGASVTMLISEEKVECGQTPDGSDICSSEAPGPLPEAVVAHLDKSHITVHTYPENHPDQGISTFRADIDVSTCGKIYMTKMILKEFDLDNYLFGTGKKSLLPGEKKRIKQELKREMAEIFSGRNIPKV